MQALEAKKFLVEETAEQAALENVPLSDLEKRMMYFTETGECPEDPIALNNAFEAEYDTTVYEKKISRLMDRAYRRIKRNNPKKLRLWNDAFGVLGKGDHYLLLFWRQNELRRSPRMWRTYVLLALAVTSFGLLSFLLFGNRARMRHGQQAPIDKYIPPLSPLVQHTLQFLLLLVFLLAVFPQLFSKLERVCCAGSCNRPHWLGDKSRIAQPLFETIALASSRGRFRKLRTFGPVPG